MGRWRCVTVPTYIFDTRCEVSAQHGCINAGLWWHVGAFVRYREYGILLARRHPCNLFTVAAFSQVVQEVQGTGSVLALCAAFHAQRCRCTGACHASEMAGVVVTVARGQLIHTTTMHTDLCIACIPFD